MHKVSFTQLLPASYESRIKAVDGVVAVSPQTWFGAWFRDERNQFPTFPSDPEAYLRIYPEIKLAEEQKQAWFADRAGALVGRAIADLYGWKVGDQVPLRSAIWRRGEQWTYDRSSVLRRGLRDVHPRARFPGQTRQDGQSPDRAITGRGRGGTP